jgi:hypothetical protein
MLDPRARQRFAEGCRGPAACCAAKAFWVVGPSLPWAMTTRVAVCGFVCSLFIILEKGVFAPIIRGPLWSSPTVAPEPLQRYP